jgi:predicted acyltransferase
MDIVSKPAKLLTQSMPGTIALLDGFSAAPEAATAPMIPEAKPMNPLKALGLTALVVGIGWSLYRRAGR